MRLFAIVLLLLIVTSGYAGSIVLEGRYQQRNIFVINATATDGVGFCIYEVTVNGLVSSDEINSQAFEIDLSIYNFKHGDAVMVEVKHKDGCTPKILNPGALEPSPSFDCNKIEVNQSGVLTWETTGELGKLLYVVQQFKWNKWVNVGEVTGNGTSGKNSYSFQVSLTSGLNKFRVAQKSYEGDLRKSKTCEITSSNAPVTFRYDKKSKTISFSAETAYELYNIYGQIVKRGFGLSVDCNTLIKGEYYLSYDSKTDKFTKK
jgi:hypothetical protein